MLRAFFHNRWLIAITGLAFLLLTYFVGYKWELQWSTTTGNSRTVHRVWSIPLPFTKTKPTILSDWRNSDQEDANWITVAGGPHHFALVSYSWFRVHQHFITLEYWVTDPETRSQYAEFVLSRLHESERISKVSRRCQLINSSPRLLFEDLDFESNPIPIDHLKSLWKRPEDELSR